MAVTDRESTGIRLVSATGEALGVIVAPEPGTFFTRGSWSPGGKRLAYATRRQTSAGVKLTLETRRRDGSGAAVVFSGRLHDFVWSPDGRLLFSDQSRRPRPASRSCNQVKVDEETGVADGEPRQITQAADFSFSRPAVTADGRRLSFLVNRHRIDVYIARFDAAAHRLSDLRRAVLRNADNWPVAWTHQSDAILFQSNLSGLIGIYSQPIRTSDVQQVRTRVHADAAQFTISPDGRHYLYVAAEPPGRVMRVPTKGGTPTELLTLDRPAHSSWLKCARLPAKTCLASVSTDDKLQLSVFDSAHGRPRWLPDLPAPPLADSWDVSADGAKLVSLQATPNVGRLIVLDLAQGTLQNVESDSLRNAKSVAWLADSGFVVATSLGDRGSEVLYVNASGAATTLWSSLYQRLWRPTVSPDGRWIAFASVIIEGTIWMLERF